MDDLVAELEVGILGIGEAVFGELDNDVLAAPWIPVSTDLSLVNPQKRVALVTWPKECLGHEKTLP